MKKRVPLAGMIGPTRHSLGVEPRDASGRYLGRDAKLLESPLGESPAAIVCDHPRTADNTICTRGCIAACDGGSKCEGGRRRLVDRRTSAGESNR